MKIKLVRSKIGCSNKQRKILQALGLRKVNQVKEHDNNDVIMGMVNKVKHLVEVSD